MKNILPSKLQIMRCVVKSTVHYLLFILCLCVLTSNNSYAQLSVGNVTITQASVAADSLTASIRAIREGDTTVLRIAGGRLGSGATWVWREGSCAGTIVGYGDTIALSPASTTEYFCTAEGGCNTVVCKSIVVTVDDSPLPLQLLSFSARLYQQHKALLQWETSSEIDTDYFVIEESFDGANYEYLGKVSAKNIDGTHSYQFEDENLKKGLNYYRLKMSDIDGTTVYSPVRFVNYSIENANASSVKLYPNPTSGDVVLELESSTEATISIWITSIVAQKAIGVTKTDIKNGKNVIPLTTDALADGTYMLYYQIGDSSRQGIKFVKATR